MPWLGHGVARGLSARARQFQAAARQGQEPHLHGARRPAPAAALAPAAETQGHGALARPARTEAVGLGPLRGARSHAGAVRARAILLCLAALALPAPAQAFVKSTHSVPVSQPDELGAPVALDTDVYLPSGSPPAGGWPFVEVFHGGGSSKDSGFD